MGSTIECSALFEKLHESRQDSLKILINTKFGERNEKMKENYKIMHLS